MAESRRHHGHSGTAPRGGDAGGDPHVLDRVAIVIKYYKAVLVVLVLVVAGMMQRAYTTVPVFEATAQLQVDMADAGRTAISGDSGSSYADPEPFYQTELRVIQGRELATLAARELKLAEVAEYNGQGPAQTKLTQVIELVKGKVLAPFRGPAPTAAKTAKGQPREEDMVGAFQGGIRVDQVPDTTLINVSFRSTNPEFAARAANVLAEQYVARNLAKKMESANNMLAYLNNEVATQQAKLQDARLQMAEYRESRNASSLESGQNLVQTRLQQANLDHNRAKSNLATAELQHQQVLKTDKKDYATLSFVANNTAVTNARNALGDLTRARQRLLERYKDNHPEVKTNALRFEEQQKQYDLEILRVIDQVKSNYETYKAEAENTRREFAAQEAASADLGRKSVDYSVLEQNATGAQTMLDSLLQRQNEYRVVSNNRQNNARVNEAAQVPGGPVSPNLQRAWMMALLFGFGLGIAAAFAIDYLDDTVKTPDDVRWKLKLPFLGAIPKVPGKEHPLLSGTVPPHFGEAFRALRTALVNASTDGDTKVVCTTSSQPQEGKTTTTVNMALSLAIGGARVLVIDADMRRPSLHKALKIENSTGLAEVLAEKSKLRAVVRRTSHPNLLAITAGDPPDNPSELLAGERMKLMIKQLSQSPFDWVIIDTPPVLAVTDAVILAPLVSGVTFIIGAEMTRWRTAERAIETLQSGQPKSIAAVLNRVDLQRNRYYYWRYYGHKYYGYYGDKKAAS